jgi:hypothetical protein
MTVNHAGLSVFQIFEEHVVDSARDGALPSDSATERLLQAEITGAAARDPSPVLRLPALAQSLSGRTIMLSEPAWMEDGDDYIRRRGRSSSRELQRLWTGASRPGWRTEADR